MIHRIRAVSVAACMGVLVALLVAVPEAAHAVGTTYFVAPTGCGDGNAGTSSDAPLCTITAAAKKATAGDTVQVAAGTYHEQVTPVSGGVTYQGTSQSQVLGTDTVPGAAWAPASGGAWWAQPGWPVSPVKVSAGSTRLTRAVSATDVATTVDTWFWDASTSPASILVNTGSDPGSTIQGSWTYGFLVRGLTDVTIDGFQVTGQSSAGISLDSGTSGSTVKNSTVSQSGGYGISDSAGMNNTISGVRTMANTSIGIRILNSSGDLVSDSTSDHNGFHGVSVQGGSGNTVRNVTAYANLRAGTRVAAGIDVSTSSSGALVEQNTTYGNDDSGIEIYTGSTGAVVRDNVSYDNNDHGIDISKAPSSTVVSNTVVGNNSSGINVEGGSTDTIVRDNIAVDNTAIPDRSKGDIRVDAASVTGTTLNHDLVFQTTATSTPIFEWNGTTYTEFDAFKASSGQESSGMVQDPRFVSLATGDLRLTGHSPAVDAADTDAPRWTMKDHEGAAPADNPTVPNTGSGPSRFADLGALEFTGAYALPPVTSVASADGLTLAVDASNSGTLGEPANSQTIDCGNGQPTVTGSTAGCRYAKSGSYTVTTTVTGKAVNGTSWTDAASTTVGVQQDLPPTAVLSVTPSTVMRGGSVTADASGSGDDRAGASYDLDCGNGTPHSAGSATSRTCTYPETGTFTVTLVVTDSAGQTATTSHQVSVEAAPVAALALSTDETLQGESVTLDGSGSQPGSAPISAYRFDCGDGSAATTGAVPTRTCTYDRMGQYPVSLTVTDALGHHSSATGVVTVGEGARPTARLKLSRYRIHRHHAVTARAGSSQGTAVSEITAYRFACGNRHRTRWQTASRSRCYYPKAGRYRVTVWVRSSLGLVDTATRVVRVRR